MLSEIATAGVGVALDDFGAGYASLGHLRRLPLTQLKIEHPAQLERLVDLGCDLGQGFLFGQPELASALSD